MTIDDFISLYTATDLTAKGCIPSPGRGIVTVMAQYLRPPKRRRRGVARIVVWVTAASVVGALVGAAIAHDALIGMAIRYLLSSIGAASWSHIDVGFREARVEKFRIGSEISAERVAISYRWDDLVLGRVAEVAVHGLNLDMTDESGRVWAAIRGRVGGTAGSSTAPLPRVRIDAATARVAAAGLAADVVFDVAMTPDGNLDLKFQSGTVRTTAGTTMTAHGIAGKATYATGRLHSTVTVEEVQAAGATVRNLSVTGTVESSPASWRIALGPAKARAAIHGRDAVLDAATIEVDVPKGGSAAAVSARVVDLAFRHGINGRLSGPFRASGSASYAGGSVSGEIGIAPPGASNPILNVKARIGLAGDAADVQGTVVPIRWGDGGLRLAELSPDFAHIDIVRGSVSGAISLNCRDRRCDGTAEAELDNLSIAAPMAWIEGVTGRLRLSRLDPLTSAGIQEIRALRIAIAGGPADVPVLETPRLRFHIGPEPDRRLVTIDRAEVGLVGMQLSISDAAVAPGAPVHRLTLGVDQADLIRLLPVLGVEGISGVGILSGSIPIEVRGDKVAVAGGRLSAVGPGVLRVQSEKIRRALAAGGEKAELVATAIEDFRFSTLVLSIDKDAEGEGVMKLSTKGHNPAVLNGHPLVVNVSLSGNVDRLLRQVQQLYALSERALGASMKK